MLVMIPSSNVFHKYIDILVDLYHWILAKHKEYKEATSKTKIPQKTLEDSSNINLMEINLSIFFWSIYEVNFVESSIYSSHTMKLNKLVNHI